MVRDRKLKHTPSVGDRAVTDAMFRVCESSARQTSTGTPPKTHRCGPGLIVHSSHEKISMEPFNEPTNIVSSQLVRYGCHNFVHLCGHTNPQCPSIEPQITIHATDDGSNILSLELINSGPIASSVTAVYFDDRALLLSGFQGRSRYGTVFFPTDGTVTPPNLPGGNLVNPAFVVTLGIDSAADVKNGVGPGESLTLLLNLTGTANIAAVADAFMNGDLRIGLHVQSIGSADSASLISNSLPQGTPRNLSDVPEPGTYGLMGAGLALFGLAGSARRKLAKRV